MLGRLGAGGQGDAYLAQSEAGWCVVKRIRADTADFALRRAWMAREVQALRAIDSPLIARLLDSDLNCPDPWFAMEFIPGTTLGRYVEDSGPLSGAALEEFARGLAKCLNVIQLAGVTHRDLKPANVMMSPSGVRLIDFGAASYSEATQLTKTGDIVGTMLWMAPEQLTDSVADSATDVHAWGLLVYYAASGKVPVVADSPAATMYQILNTTPEPPGGIAGPLAGLAANALRKDPRTRPTVTDILTEIAPVPSNTMGSSLSADEAGVLPSTLAGGEVAPPQLQRSNGRRGPIGVLAGLAVLAVLVGLAAVLLVGHSSPPSDAGAATTTPSASPSRPRTPTAKATPTQAPRPTVTVTKTRTPERPATKPTATRTVTKAPPARPTHEPRVNGNQGRKPRSWPAYEYFGPTDFDVCIQSDFPLPEQLLKKGSGAQGGTDTESEVIRSAQAGLRSLNYGKPEPVDVTGYFGPATKAALQSFQNHKGLVVDGSLGQQTWSELNYWVNHYAGNCAS